MTSEQAFNLHMVSLFHDAINNHTGILKSVVDRLKLLDNPPKDEIHGDVGELLGRLADTLQKKMNRAVNDIKQRLGGEEGYRLLNKEDFWADHGPSAHQWQDAPVPSALPTRVLLSMETDGMRAFDASTDEAMYRNAKMILHGRIQKGYYLHQHPQNARIYHAAWVDDTGKSALSLLQELGQTKILEYGLQVIPIETTYLKGSNDATSSQAGQATGSNDNVSKGSS